MSNVNFEDLCTPFTEKTHRKLIGHLHKEVSAQVAAASSAADQLWQATFDGQIGDLYAIIKTTPGAGESMAIDVKKNGASILTSALTISSTTSGKLVSLQALIDPAKRSFVIGDVFTVDRTYVAGGTPAPIANNSIWLEPSIGPYVE